MLLPIKDLYVDNVEVAERTYYIEYSYMICEGFSRREAVTLTFEEFNAYWKAAGFVAVTPEYVEANFNRIDLNIETIIRNHIRNNATGVPQFSLN